tara:strand:- start:57 stop:455 length:399 start_codon:yes stop_codon:yes gene_type:complete
MIFRNEYYFLSNMYPCNICYEEGSYKSVESVFQMMKCADDNEKKGFEFLNGFEAKKRGRRVKLRSDWHEVKVDVMKSILESKFSNPELLNKLKAVKGEIVEDNHWGDRYWGRCNGVGKNMLGKLLMEIRDGG